MNFFLKDYKGKSFVNTSSILTNIFLKVKNTFGLVFVTLGFLYVQSDKYSKAF